MIKLILKYPSYVGFETMAFAPVKGSLVSDGVLLQDVFFYQGIIKKKSTIYSNNVHVKNCFSQETENPAAVSAFDFGHGEYRTHE